MAGLPPEFVHAVLEVEEAAAILLEAKRTASVDKAREGAARGRSCTQICIEAADILASLGEAAEARAVLRAALTLDGPTAPLQHHYSRHCRIAGDLDEASHWLKGAMLRARPNAAMALELCEIEYARRNDEAAADALMLSLKLRWNDAERLRQAYRQLIGIGRPQAALVPAMMLHLRRADDARHRRELTELLEAYRPYDELPAGVIEHLRLDRPATGIDAAAASAHDQLMGAFDRTQVISAAAARERSGRWLDDAALWGFLRDRLVARSPFSFVRASDGEGRFVAAMHRSLFPPFGEQSAEAILRQIWWNWFGQDVGQVARDDLQALSESLAGAYANAGLVGITSAGMYEHDSRHFAYRAALDRWFERLNPGAGQHYTEAAYNLFLNRRDPFLAGLLSGISFVGVISPYDDLAKRLADRLGIAAHRDYVIPGETRLGRHQEQRNRGTHFPNVFRQIMERIEVPFAGACFLVAGGLLGKIYCERIRQLGGIALDIGALADGWMGHNTRGEGFDAAVPNRLDG